jgi:hypothetical protein
MFFSYENNASLHAYIPRLPSNWSPPDNWATPILHKYVTDVFSRIHRLFAHTPPLYNRIKANINAAIVRLKNNKDVVIKPADKNITD